MKQANRIRINISKVLTNWLTFGKFTSTG